MITLWTEFLGDQAGATAIEYAMIAGGLSIAIVAIVNTIGTGLATIFTAINAGF
jgi:pilus assembly protein Flp/PilA